MPEFLQYPAVQLAITGALAAAAVDFDAFRKWKKWRDVADYDWGIATFRWFQGALVGAAAAFGFGAIA